jgi:formylmethanofuran dehydrogenase subunit E
MTTITTDPQTIERVLAVHGGLCPALAMGIQAAQLALQEVGSSVHGSDVVAVAEGDMCSLDAIQVLTGCTVGNRNLIVTDDGKNAFTFYRRGDGGKAVRIASRPEAWDWDAEHLDLWAKVQAGTATEAEDVRFSELHAERARTILATPPEALFTVTPVEGPAPVAPRAPRPSVACSGCGEMVIEAKVHLFEGRTLCLACFNRAVFPAA